MAYGTVKVDNITFDNGGSDQNVTVSGLYRATTSGVTLSGTIAATTVSGVTIIGSTTVSGATVTGTTANFTSGNFSNIISSAATMSGELIMANQQQVRFREAVGNGVNHIALQAPTIVSADQTITLPDQTGTVVTTGDNGSVTSTMILDGTILNVDINASAGIVDTKLATIATAGKVSNSATTATNANTASAIVARDASGNFTAGTITAALTGAASSNVLKAGDTMTGALVVPLASAATPSLTFTSDLNTGIYSPGADQLAISTNGTGRLFVDASGNVGVGTASPVLTFGDRVLHVAGTQSANSEVRLTHTDSGTTSTDGFTFLLTGSDGFVYNRENGNLVFGTNNTERMRLDSSGRLGIGTSSPVYPLHVAGTTGSVFVGNSLEGLATGTNNGGAIYFGVGTTTATTPTAGIEASWGDTTAPQVHLGITRDGNKTRFSALSDNTLRFYTNNTEKANINGNGTLELQANAGQAPFLAQIGGSEVARIDSSGRLLVGTSSDSGGALLQVNDNRIRIATANTPASAGATGTTGEIAWDADYIYVCTATNTWKRTAISTW